MSCKEPDLKTIMRPVEPFLSAKPSFLSANALFLSANPEKRFGRAAEGAGKLKSSKKSVLLQPF